MARSNALGNQIAFPLQGQKNYLTEKKSANHGVEYEDERKYVKQTERGRPTPHRVEVKRKTTGIVKKESKRNPTKFWKEWGRWAKKKKKIWKTSQPDLKGPLRREGVQNTGARRTSFRKVVGVTEEWGGKRGCPTHIKVN